MDWLHGHSDTFDYVRVDKTTRREKERLTTISACDLSSNLNSALKDSGTLKATELSDLQNDMIRVYLNATDASGTTERLALATMYAKDDGSLQEAAAESFSMKLHSALLPTQAKCKTSYVIDASGNIIEEAEKILTALGIPFVSSPCDKILSDPLQWKAGTAWLSILNDLMAIARYWSVRPDAYGRALLMRYEPPEQRAPVWEFVSGANCNFVPKLKKTSNRASVPNVCILTCSRIDKEPITASYTNDGTEYPFIGSPFSTVAVGYEIPISDTVDDAISEADLLERCKERLAAESHLAESYDVICSFAKVCIGDVVRLRWISKGIDFYATVQSIDSECIAGVPMTLTVKRIWR